MLEVTIPMQDYEFEITLEWLIAQGFETIERNSDLSYEEFEELKEKFKVELHQLRNYYKYQQY